MLFVSPVFLFLFLPLTLAGFILLGRRFGARAATRWLLFASLFYYGWWRPEYLLLIVASMAFNFAVGTRLARSPSRLLLGLGVGGNLLALGYYKYAGFAAESLNWALDLRLPVPEIVLPLAISFFTFQQIAYLVDAHRGTVPPQQPGHYALFISFFPQLIAGPIVHHKEMMPQFERPDLLKLSAERVTLGLTMFFLGMGKKLLLADNVAPYANDVFGAVENGTAIGAVEAWIGTLAYTLQLYFDFSGYCDMAIGAAFLFGIRLPINFDSPYQAGNIIDFWRRWHITLSRFLRDYLYIPLGGNRYGRARRHLNLFLTMLLGGLWHGASWAFVLWGALHGLYLVINHGWRAIRGSARVSRAELLVARGLTFAAVVLAWVPFRAANLKDTWAMWGALFGVNGIRLPTEFATKLAVLQPLFAPLDVRFVHQLAIPGVKVPVLLLAALLIIVLILPNSHRLLGSTGPLFSPRSAHAQPRPLRWAPTGAWGAAIGVVALLSILSLNRISDFLYFRF